MQDVKGKLHHGKQDSIPSHALKITATLINVARPLIPKRDQDSHEGKPNQFSQYFRQVMPYEEVLHRYMHTLHQQVFVWNWWLPNVVCPKRPHDTKKENLERMIHRNKTHLIKQGRLHNGKELANKDTVVYSFATAATLVVLLFFQIEYDFW